MLFEIHLTVKPDKDIIDFESAFLSLCLENSIKPLFLDLGKDVPAQITTSTKHVGDTYNSCFNSIDNIEALMELHDISIIRKKIETGIHNYNRIRMPPYNFEYFETHFKIKKLIEKHPYGKERWQAKLLSTAKFHNFFISTNMIKRADYVWGTYRSKFPDTVDAHLTVTDRILSDLQYDNYEILDTVSEVALYDDNTSLDDEWLKNSNPF